MNELRVLKLFLGHPSKLRCGYEVGITLSIPRPSAYSVLRRMEDAGWLSSLHEREADRTSNGQSARKLYRITGIGHQNASLALAMLQMAST